MKLPLESSSRSDDQAEAKPRDLSTPEAEDIVDAILAEFYRDDDAARRAVVGFPS